MSQSDMRFARGLGGMPLREIFFKWCNLVYVLIRFCLSKITILSFKNYHFLYKNFKNTIFLYKIFKKFHFLFKKMNILDTRLLCGNSCNKTFENMYN